MNKAPNPPTDPDAIIIGAVPLADIDSLQLLVICDHTRGTARKLYCSHWTKYRSHFMWCCLQLGLDMRYR